MMNAHVQLNTPRLSGAPVYAVIYARYSSHSQGEQSIEGQLTAARKYAEAKSYTVVGEYIDRAMTGKNDNRDAFQQMLSDTAKHQFQVVIVWKVDRFGRNREEITFNKHRCKKNGVKVEYVAENLPDSNESVILESVLEGMAEYYSLQLSQNILRGQRESAAKAQCIGGNRPLGYLTDPQTKKFIVDPKTAPTVQTIFRMYASGSTVTEIITYLNEQGLRTLRGGPFTKNSLHAMLKNEKYIGVYTYKDEVRIEDGLPALIDKDTFARVQELLKVNRRAPAHTWARADYLLTDKLFCGTCGSSMVGESGTSKTGAKHNYYICTKKKRERACDKKAVRQDWIEPLVIQKAMDVLNNDELLKLIVDRSWEHYVKHDAAQKERASIEAQLADINKSITNLLRAIEAGIFNSATKDRMDELDAQKAALNAALAELELAQKYKLTRGIIEHFLFGLRDFDENDPGFQKRLISVFVNSVFVYDDKVKLVFNFSGESRVLMLNEIDTTEQGEGFVYSGSCSTITHGYEPRIAIFGTVFVITIKRPEG